ncbi:MAG: wax ester/triacylglycerol synthase family O-acyltransferase, partial [Lapillicoccus sp.]
MERLTPLAAAFLDSEDEEPTTSMAIGSLAVFAGPAPAFTDFVRHIEGRLPAVPRYRQTLRTVPLDLAAPAWVDDAAFDVRWHIRHTALPAPGGREQVGQLVSRVMSRRMDRSRPLWEYWFIEGLADGRWALLSKLHHSMADGVSGTDIYHHVLDPTPEPRPPVPDTWTPAPAASPLSFAADAGWDLARTPVTAAAATVRALASPRQLVRQAAEAARGLITMSAALRPVDASSLLGPLDGSLRYAWAQVSLDDIRAVRRGLGGTVNDVALAAVTGGFRQLLLSRSEEPTPHMLRSMVPVSTRQPGAEGVPDNRVSMMFLCLPVDLAEPEGWLRTVQERGRTHRDTGEPQAGAAMSTLAAYEPFLPVSIGMRLGFRFPQRSVSTVTTNVPGPRATLYGLGRELEEILPFVPIANRVRVSVAIFSYRDTVTFGITGDYSSVPDI